MFTVIRTQDGRLIFRLHASPEELSPEQADRALSALDRLRQALEDSAGVCSRAPIIRRRSVRYGAPDDPAARTEEIMPRATR